MSRALALLALALLAGCAGKPVKPPAPEAREGVSHRAVAKPRAGGDPAATAAATQAACLQVREHRDEDYTPGGLYAPGVRDSAVTCAPMPTRRLTKWAPMKPLAPVTRMRSWAKREVFSVLMSERSILDQDLLDGDQHHLDVQPT